MAPTPVFPAEVTATGKLRLDDARGFARHLAGKAGKRVEVVVRLPRSQRSLQANRYYWGVVVALMGDAFGYEKEEMHEVLAMRFLRIEDCPVTGAPRRKRTPECDTKEFAEYVESCMRLAAEHGVYIPEPYEVEVS